MRPLFSVVMLVIILAITGEALALTVDVPVTPAYLKQRPKEFSIRAEKRDDGLIHFTITRHLSEPRHLVARFTVRDKGSIVLDCSFPSFVREKTAKYYLAVSPQQLSNAHIELSESGFNDFNAADKLPPHPWVGSTDYQIHLADFVPKASKTSGD
jgi:hypothetical protein